MSDPRWFYHDEEEWNAVAERLKLTPCPHCQTVGTLNRHGTLVGYDDRSPTRKTLRARRVFCSNRGRRTGCGRTVSIWWDRVIRRSSLSTPTLWAFLKQAVSHGLAAALRTMSCSRSPRTWQRMGRRFHLAQSRIRTALLTRGPPPELPTPSRPAAQVLAHLHATFPDADCPLAAFQQATRSFVV